ncbi:MAG: hypothetical protein LRY50_13050 [Geovibrio sp.]|nr:hypothetical protein [Geovibrio sp.]
MNKMIIEGNKKLTGEIKISGAKNSAVALVPAALLSDEGAIIENIPNISDISALKDILNLLGAKIEETMVYWQSKQRILSIKKYQK